MNNETPLEVYEDIPNISQNDFFDMVYNQGQQLVILDEFVVDVTDFINKHPGGQFALKHNIGRDVSKFFYGGYSLEGNIDRSRPRRGVIHSNLARKIVN